MEVAIHDVSKRVVLAIIEVLGFDNSENQSLNSFLDTQLQSIKEGLIDDKIKTGIRNLLRNGTYAPSGRAKPASEFLINTFLTSGQFPSINPIVNINNYISIKSSLPASVFDLNKINGPIQLRLGHPSESYVFNNAGHEIKLTDLITLADDNGPFGTPVKDSMRCKCFSDCKNALGVIYCAKSVIDLNTLKRHMNEWQELCQMYLQASNINMNIIGYD